MAGRYIVRGMPDGSSTWDTEIVKGLGGGGEVGEGGEGKGVRQGRGFWGREGGKRGDYRGVIAGCVRALSYPIVLPHPL